MTLAALFFLLICSINIFASWSATVLTCVPPLDVEMELAKETCWKEPSETQNAISQRPSVVVKKGEWDLKMMMMRTVLARLVDDRRLDLRRAARCIGRSGHLGV